MKNYTILTLLCICLTAPLYGQKLTAGYSKIKELGGIKEFKLESNGMAVLLKEDHSAPVLTFMITYNVGSRNEVIGNTGSAHLFEHLMFKGTPNFNKKNGTSITSSLQNVGALMNATTWLDRTNYFENLPNDQLELAIKIEADRMRNSFINEEDRQAEMTVVRNEFEQGENNPDEALDKQIWALAFQAHPYHHSTIGWRSDIENVPIETLKAFYDTYYWPNNATVSLIGDFQENNALELIKKYFGAISKSPKPIPQVYTTEPDQQGMRRVVVKRTGQLGVVGVAHKIPKGLDKDTYAIKVLGSILTEGKTSRLYSALIDKGLATSIFPFNFTFKDPGLFIPYVFLTPGTKHEEVEKIILDEYEKIKTAGVTAEEVNRAISKIASQKAYINDGSYSVASELNEAIAIGDWTYYVTYLDNIQKVKAADVQTVAKKYFVDDLSTIGYFLPQSASGSASTMQGGGSKFWKPGASVHQPLYYRNSAVSVENESENSKNTSVASNPVDGNFASQVQFKTINGAKVYAMKTAVKDVVTITGSIYAGEVTSPADKAKLANFVGSMLDKGTVKKSKFEIAQQLENLGATLSFNAGKHTLTFNAKCLKKDLPTVISLLEEQLKFPAFKPEEVDKLKKQFKASLQQSMESTDFMATEAVLGQIFQKGHPNNQIKVEQAIQDIDKITVEDLKAFHKKYYGPASMVIVAVGDVDVPAFQKMVSESLKGFSGGIPYPKYPAASHIPAEKKVIVEIKDKASATLSIGIATGVKRTDKDFLPLYAGNYIIGGNFSARLMSIVRDDEGLTYGIYSGHTGDVFSDGYFILNGNFAPQLLDKGYASTMREFNRWVKEGVTGAELKSKKATIVGAYKVQLATTTGIANQIHNTALLGYPVSYMDEYPRLVESLTLDQVNTAIKKYIDPAKMVVVMAGSIDKEGKPQGAASGN